MSTRLGVLVLSSIQLLLFVFNPETLSQVTLATLGIVFQTTVIFCYYAQNEAEGDAVSCDLHDNHESDENYMESDDL